MLATLPNEHDPIAAFFEGLDTLHDLGPNATAQCAAEGAWVVFGVHPTPEQVERVFNHLERCRVTRHIYHWF